MRKYLNKPIEELARELVAGLARLKKDYVDAAEELGRIIDPDRQYPHDFVVYRVTGYRPTSEGEVLMDGRSLRRDLGRLILDVSSSFSLATREYPEKVWRLSDLRSRFQVTEKTLNRWMDEGLVARRLTFPDGSRWIGFLESSVESFSGARGLYPVRAPRFSRLSAADRRYIIEGAREMKAATRLPITRIARHLARRTGRAVETIRYTIRHHDAERPQEAIFPPPARLEDAQKVAIYEDYLRGTPVALLRKRYKTRREKIYHAYFEVWADRLLRQPIAYVPSPEFDRPGAEEAILSASALPPAAPSRRPSPKAPEEAPAYLQSLYEVPLLDARAEHDLFRRYNYLKYQAANLRGRIDRKRIRVSLLREVEDLLVQASVVKNRIIRANLRLVVSIAKKHLAGPMGLFELISDGNVSLIRAVEKFDYTRGHRFSTYASWAIMRNFARSVPREQHQLDRFSTGHEEVLDVAGLRAYDPAKTNLSELRESIDVVLGRLTPTERSILVEHYGLNEAGQTRTLDQLGRSLGMSKERVRQIELKALRKLRSILRPQRADLLT
jgi:RNA polymerase sigma factor (sigma-70 family)